MKYQISVVMPALNEEANIERAVLETINAFSDLNIAGEIVVVNDGSKDKTGSIVEKMCGQFPFVKVIHHKVPCGIGASFWEGAHAAAGDVVTMLPGDGENDPVEILRYLPLMEHVDIVIPFMYNVEIRDWRRRWLSRAYKAIINVTFGLLLNYMNGTVLYRKSVLEKLTLNSRGFFYQTELLIRAIRMGFLYAEVPYALGQRGSGKSKALTVPSFFKLSRDYLHAIYSVFFVEKKAGGQMPEDCMTVIRRNQLAKILAGNDQIQPISVSPSQPSSAEL